MAMFDVMDDRGIRGVINRLRQRNFARAHHGHITRAGSSLAHIDTIETGISVVQSVTFREGNCTLARSVLS